MSLKPKSNNTGNMAAPANVWTDNPENHAAAAKLWAVYVSEAEKYDKGLVESWRSDMEGMLIFAGLFSASLTAFLIESYKTLVPDSGDTTVLLLSQISGQLAASANGTAFNFVQRPQFTPPASALICNILWFISLGFSLACALIATLLEQWARDFLHKAEMRSAPVIRARVFSYLYYGLKRFEMHTVVEIIPLLLHASLLLFFAGLVAFLIPVNIFITAIAAAILATVILVYATLTLLPLFHPDCPYRTPLSGGFWQLRKLLQTLLRRRHPISLGFPRDKVMVDSVFRQATTPSDERYSRDGRALIWTLNSLTDDVELEPFIDAIPDVLWRTFERRLLYDGHIYRLIEDPASDLLRRIQDFQQGCYSDIISVEVAKRRKISCYKAIWALGSLSTPENPIQIQMLSRPQFVVEPEVLPHYISAQAIQAWATLCAAKGVLDRTLRHLRTVDQVTAAKQQPNRQTMVQIRSGLAQLRNTHDLRFNRSTLEDSDSADIPPEVLSLAAKSLIDVITGLPLQTLLDYIGDASRSEKIPYRFEPTQALLSPPSGTVISRRALCMVQVQLDTVVYDNLERFTSAPEHIWLDGAFCKIVSYWDPQESGGTLPWAVVDYLTGRRFALAVSQALRSIPSNGWRRLPETILHGPADTPRQFDDLYPNGRKDSLTTRLTVVWTLCRDFDDPVLGSGLVSIDLSTWKAILAAVSQTEHQYFTYSVIAMVKRAVLRYLEREIATLSEEDLALRFNEPVLLPEASSLEMLIPYATEEHQAGMRTGLMRRYTEEGLDTLTEFLQQCRLTPLLRKSAQTMKIVGGFLPQSAIHPERQLRFATAVKELFAGGDPTLLQEFPTLTIWQPYSPTNNAGLDAYPWLNDFQAREILQETFRTYLRKAAPESRLFAQIHEIVTQLDALHSSGRDQPVDETQSSSSQVIS
ncbi:hypothetical protein C8F04DRAFT_1399039 [Mycena alexandri]|uniref:DUF6535 domain-containing protein n=1 Tax=Mycena alexandri TaxID=1745969 RepID=A0AAD6SLG3_9AGAR|nr:hypothetical protein C8F04DRAFT_1399039 [Mycena alexandri]